MKKYTIEEIEYLIKNYHNTPNVVISKTLNRNESAIITKAHSLNLKKSKEYMYNMIVTKNKKNGRDLCYDNLFKIAALYKTRAEFQYNDPSAYRIALLNGWLNDLCLHMKKMSYSIPQLLLFDLLKKIFINDDIKYNDRKTIKPYELDIFIPNYNIAFEYDGKGWHKNNDNDKIKDMLCEKKGIKLIRIVENNRKYEEDIKTQIIKVLNIINEYCDMNITKKNIKDITLTFEICDILDEDYIIKTISKYNNIHDFKKNEIKLYDKLVKLKKLKNYTSNLNRKQKIWNEDEINYLKRNYSKRTINELMLYFSTSKNSIYMKAYKLGLKKGFK